MLRIHVGLDNHLQKCCLHFLQLRYNFTQHSCTQAALPPPLLVAAEVADFHNTEKKLVINGWTDYLYSAEYQQLLSQHALYCTVKTL